MPKLRKITREEFENIPEDIEDTPDVPHHTDAHDIAPYHHIQKPSDTLYPSLTAWVLDRGWIEIGADEFSGSMIRILDIGGVVWESQEWYPSLTEALSAADTALAELEADGEI